MVIQIIYYHFHEITTYRSNAIPTNQYYNSYHSHIINTIVITESGVPGPPGLLDVRGVHLLLYGVYWGVAGGSEPVAKLRSGGG